MYRYQIYCLQVDSDLEFPQLSLGDKEKNADITVKCGDLHRNPEIPEKIKYEVGSTFSWLENKTCFLEVRDGDKVEYRLKDGMNVMDLRTYILGWGFSFLAFQRRELAMHSSVVANQDGAVLICGESGCGKSTVTTSFLESGYRLLADDMSFVETMDGVSYVKPAFPFQKLCRDAAMNCGCPMEEMIYIDEEKDKFFVPYKGKFDGKKEKIKAMIVLYRHAGDRVECMEITGIGKMHACLNNLFARYLLKEQKYAPEIGALGLKMAGSIPIYAIGRPEGQNTIREVVERALSLAEESADL